MVAEEEDEAMIDNQVMEEEEAVKDTSKNSENHNKMCGHPGRDKFFLALRKGFEVMSVRDSSSKRQPNLRAKHFNEVPKKDVFHIKWTDEKKKVVVLIDIFMIQNETKEKSCESSMLG